MSEETATQATVQLNQVVMKAGMGKTSMMVTIAGEWAIRGYDVAYFAGDTRPARIIELLHNEIIDHGVVTKDFSGVSVEVDDYCRHCDRGDKVTGRVTVIGGIDSLFRGLTPDVIIFDSPSFLANRFESAEVAVVNRIRSLYSTELEEVWAADCKPLALSSELRI